MSSDLPIGLHSGSPQNRINDPANYTLVDNDFENILERAAELSKNQLYCRILQQKLDEGDTVMISRIFEKVSDQKPQVC